MSRAHPYIPAGYDWQGRIEQTTLQAYEDAAGTCNTCPGELDSAESCYQRDPSPPPYPWRALGTGLAVVFMVLGVVHLVASVAPQLAQVAAR